jgi:hypothetical protein
MITEWNIEQDGDRLLLGLSVGSAVLDILTSTDLLHGCIKFLESAMPDALDVEMGSFGHYPVRLNRHADDSTSIFVDGPDFLAHRNQSAGVYLEKDELLTILRNAIEA